MICDVDTYNVLQALPYTEETDGNEEGLGDHVMTKLMNLYFDTGLNMTTDVFLQTFVQPTSSKDTK